MVDPTDIIRYTHEDFIRGVKKISAEIKQSDFKPDYILGLVRGGSIPAVHLSHTLKVPVTMINWNTRDSTRFGNTPNPNIPIDIFEGSKVLIVDDIVDGGETISTLLESWDHVLRNRGVLPKSNYRIASLWYNTALRDKNIVVDYYHLAIDRTEDSRWIHFDWEG